MKKTNILLWWRNSKEEIDEQVKGYNTLRPWKSARKLSGIFLLFSAIVTAAFSQNDFAVLIESAILLSLGIFIYRGHKWAMIAAMVIWSAEKSIYIYSSPKTVVVQLIWWALYLKCFYLAYKVENAMIGSIDKDPSKQVA